MRPLEELEETHLSEEEEREARFLAETLLGKEKFRTAASKLNEIGGKAPHAIGIDLNRGQLEPNHVPTEVEESVPPPRQANIPSTPLSSPALARAEDIEPRYMEAAANC